MLKKNHFLFLLFLIYSLHYGQNNNFTTNEIDSTEHLLKLVQIRTDTLFKSKQIINILSMPKSALNLFQVDLAYSKTELLKTSMFAKNRNAIAAINAGFFDVKKGGSVAYLEINDSVISRSRDSKLQWAKPDSLINAAFIVTKENRVQLERAMPDKDYELSHKEKVVLRAGPVLLSEAKKVKLPKMEFVFKRHPRTCIALSRDNILFITIDGRSKEADGMSLIEVQDFLFNYGCVDAINLDGGGSTTLWINDKGIVNSPSDTTGERSVSNAILILRK